MRNRQRGLSIVGLIFGSVILIFVLLLGMKMFPPYLEYFTAKKHIIQIAQEQRAGTVGDVRKAWQLKTAIEDVGAITDKDLEITKDAGEIVISFAYRKEVPLFANIGIYFDFAATSRASERASN